MEWHDPLGRPQLTEPPLDAYEAFEEEGVFNPAVGRRYREAILEAGGSRTALESFKAFRGREPRIDALLRHQGMAG